MSFFAELRRRNVIRVALAYLVLSWLALQIADVLVDTMELPAVWSKAVLGLLLVGFLPTLVFAWVYELTPEGIKKESEIAAADSITAHTAKKLNVAVIVLLVAAMGMFAADRFLGGAGRDGGADPVSGPGAAPELSIAVLPFANMSADPENEYFADGLSEELLNVLAQIKGLKVAGRTSSFHFKGRNEDLRKIGEMLGVANILEGSVRRQGDQVRITAQLIQASDGFHLWSETYDRRMDDIFAIQDEISGAVAGALRVTLLGQDDTARAAGPSAVSANIDPQAYSRFIAAKARVATRDADKVLEAVRMLREVTEEAPDFAQAHAALAIAALLARGNDRTLTADEASALAGPAVERAMELAPADDYVAAARGLYLTFIGDEESGPDDEAAERAFRRAIDLNPENVDARYWLATLLLAEDHFAEAGQLLDQALAIDPLARVARAIRIGVYQLQGEFSRAAEYARQSIELFPETWFFYTWPAQGEADRGRPDRSLLWLSMGQDAAPESPQLAALTVLACSLLDDPKGLDEALTDQAAFGGRYADESEIRRRVARADYAGAGSVAAAAAERDGVADWEDSLFSLAVQSGDCATAMGLEGVRSHLERWSGAKPDFSNFNGALASSFAYCMIRNGDEERAERLLDATLEYLQPREGRFDQASFRLGRVSALALKNEPNLAIAELSAYYEAGFGGVARTVSLGWPIEDDVVFGELRDEPEFQRIMAAIRARNAERLAALGSGELTLESPL